MVQHLKQVSNTMSGSQLQQILDTLTQTQAEIQAIKAENDKLWVQIIASATNKSPSLTTSEETEETLKSLVKALIKEGKKAKIPMPHNWSRGKRNSKHFVESVRHGSTKKESMKQGDASPSSPDT